MRLIRECGLYAGQYGMVNWSLVYFHSVETLTCTCNDAFELEVQVFSGLHVYTGLTKDTDSMYSVGPCSSDFLK